jgi:hypothetical protein
LAGFFPGLGEDREQNGGKNGDDGDHYQQLDERERSSSGAPLSNRRGGGNHDEGTFLAKNAMVEDAEV